jgi:hypothetical protein
VKRKKQQLKEAAVPRKKKVKKQSKKAENSAVNQFVESFKS